MAEIISEIWENWAFFLFLPTGFLPGFAQTIYSQSLIYLFAVAKIPPVFWHHLWQQWFQRSPGVCDIPLMAVQEDALEFLQLLEQLACKLSSLAYVGTYPVLSTP